MAGDNSGASGATSKVLEKEYTLLIAEQLRKVLSTAGVKNIFMTRTKDTSPEHAGTDRHAKEV